MIRRFLPRLGLFMAFVACLGVAAWLQHHHIEEYRKRPFQFRDALYLPSSGYVRAVAVGYDKFVADFLWLRMIQTFASAYTVPECAPQLIAYFRVISDLDPQFLDPYSFTIMGVGEEGKRPEFVKEVVEKSFVKAPGNSKVAYEGAFYANWNMNNQQLAKYYVRMAKLNPNYPTFIDRWEGFFDLKQGRFRAAFEKYLADYMHAILDNNSSLYMILERNLLRAIDGWFCSEVKARAIAWKQAHGSYPTIDELRAGGGFKGVELPNVPLIQAFTKQMIEAPPAARATVTEEVIRAFSERSVQKFDDLPAGPYDEMWPNDPGYTIWLSQPEDSDLFAVSNLIALNAARNLARAVRVKAEEYRTNHGFCPSTLKDFAPEMLDIKAPDNTPWVWDPVACFIGTRKYPDMASNNSPEP